MRPLAEEEDRVGVGADGVFVAAGSREVMLGGEGAADDEAATGLVAGLKEVVRPAKELACVLVWRPCTSRSAIQARWNKRVMVLYSL